MVDEFGYRRQMIVERLGFAQLRADILRCVKIVFD